MVNIPYLWILALFPVTNSNILNNSVPPRVLELTDNEATFSNHLHHLPIIKECAYYNGTCVKIESSTGGDISKCSGTQKCADIEKDSHDETFSCYAVWSNNTEDKSDIDVSVHMQGCIVDSGSNNHDCRNKTACLSTSPLTKHRHLTCCCDSDNCNQQFKWEPAEEELSTPAPPVAAPTTSPTLFLLMYTMVPLLVLTVIGIAAAYIYRQRKNPQFNALSTLGDDLPTSPPTPTLTRTSIQLLEIKARGRFGAVWKGQHGSEMVAVKIFPLQDKQSWYAEQEIYSVPQMSHENILKFIGIEKRGENLQQEFWLVTSFHENGSLCDYLKSHTVSWEDLCRITYSMTSGLAHLHEEIPSTRAGGIKPSIAHRDFKSKNVLIRSDLSACIGDFGLALQFQPNEIVGDTHGQVGTRRYMAPEVLEGAINFSRDAFLRIDMYACGLVLWEIASRCTAAAVPQEYTLPYEKEASPHPSLEEISDLVVQQKLRPERPAAWKMHPGLAVLCETLEECWDHDAEARLSASCVLERIYHIKSISLNQEMRNNQLNATNPVINTQPNQVICMPPYKQNNTQVAFDGSSSM